MFVCFIILLGHWINSYLLFAPGTLHEHGHLGVLEIGMGVGFLGIFLKIVLYNLSKRPVDIQHHPFLDESKHFANKAPEVPNQCFLFNGIIVESESSGN